MTTPTKTTSAKTTSKPAKGIQYSEIVKSQGGVATNSQTGAKTYAQGYQPKSGGNFAVRDKNANLTQEIDTSKAVVKNGIPDYGETPTPTTQPLPETPVSPALQPPQQAPGAITPQQALANAQASGKEAPQDAGKARQAVQDYMPAATSTFYKPSADSQQVYDSTGKALSYDQYIAAGGKADFSNVQKGLPANAEVQSLLDQNPDYQQFLADRKEANNIYEQQKSMTDTYKELSKKLGIDSLNTELMNMKNVIEGTEDDIRNEVVKAGGFATESQVQALTMARNKQLVKNYNNLLETKQMAQETLQTMIGLASQDRQYALQAIDHKLQLDEQVISLSDKMRNNAQQGYDQIIKNIGYQGLVTGDPWHDALVEKTLGLYPGGLAKLAGAAQTPVKFETVTIGSGKGNVKVRYGYDAMGNIVSATNLNTGQPFKQGATSQPTNTSTPRTTPKPAPAPTNSKLQEAVAKLNNNLGRDGYTDPRVYMAIRDRLSPKELTAFDKQNKSKLSPEERKRLGL